MRSAAAIRSVAAGLTVSATMALAGCGASASDQIAATVQRLAQATGARDYRTVCNQVLAPALVAHLTRNDIPCNQALRVALQGVHDPVISIGRITIKGKRASVIVLTVARGQQASVNAIELRDTAAGWRISALASPLTAADARRS